MALWHLILLALVQGVTEFLPVSSSAHLILVPHLTGMADQGAVIDVALHVGTLGAVVLYFRADVTRALAGTFGLLRSRRGPNERLALGLVISTIPVMIAGLILHVTGADDLMRSVEVIAWATIIFGALLWWFDRRSSELRTIAEWTPAHALQLGLWQALALIPGTSRSGACITGARALGYSREDAARIAMLMSIPTIIASAALLAADSIGAANGPLLRDAALAAGMAFVAALGALALMMRLLRTVSFTPYVVYRMMLGAFLLGWAYL